MIPWPKTLSSSLEDCRWYPTWLQSLEAVLIVDIRHLLNQEVPIAEGFASQQLVCKRSREQRGECFHFHNWFGVYNFWSTSHSALRLFSLLCKFITICSDMYQVLSCYNHHEIFWDTVSWAYSSSLPSLRFHLLPSAFLASHLLGLERCVVELRGAVLRSPMAMLRALRKTDGQVGEIDPNLMDVERSQRCENLRLSNGIYNYYMIAILMVYRMIESVFVTFAHYPTKDWNNIVCFIGFFLI